MAEGGSDAETFGFGTSTYGLGAFDFDRSESVVRDGARVVRPTEAFGNWLPWPPLRGGVRPSSFASRSFERFALNPTSATGAIATEGETGQEYPDSGAGQIEAISFLPKPIAFSERSIVDIDSDESEDEELHSRASKIRCSAQETP